MKEEQNPLATMMAGMAMLGCNPTIGERYMLRSNLQDHLTPTEKRQKKHRRQKNRLARKSRIRNRHRNP